MNARLLSIILLFLSPVIFSAQANNGPFGFAYFQTNKVAEGPTTKNAAYGTDIYDYSCYPNCNSTPVTVTPNNTYGMGFGFRESGIKLSAAWELTSANFSNEFESGKVGSSNIVFSGGGEHRFTDKIFLGANLDYVMSFLNGYNYNWDPDNKDYFSFRLSIGMNFEDKEWGIYYSQPYGRHVYGKRTDVMTSHRFGIEIPAIVGAVGLAAVGAVAVASSGGVGGGGGCYGDNYINPQGQCVSKPQMCYQTPYSAPRCNIGKACGNTCISSFYQCNVGRGSACNTVYQSYP